MIPYVLYVLKNQPDLSEIKNISKVLEAYIMRRIICKSGNDNYSDLFSLNLISNQILTSTDLIDYLLRKQGDSSLAMPNDDDLHSGFMESVLTNPRAKGVLYLLESIIRDEYQSTSLKSLNSYSLEHLLPKKWEPSVWPITTGFEVEDRNQRLKTLGNLSILPIKLNSSISNKSWETKKNGNAQRKGLLHYAGGIETLVKWLSSPIWDENKINERAEWLFNYASRVWQFGPSCHQSSDISLFPENDLSENLNGHIQDTPVSNNDSETEAVTYNPTTLQEGQSPLNRRDTTKYCLEDSAPLSKRDFVFEVIKKYITENPSISFVELKRIFPDSLMDARFVRKGLIASVDDLLDGEITEEQLNVRYYFDRADRCLRIDNTEFFVNNQHTRTSADKMLAKAIELGYIACAISENVATSAAPSQRTESNRLRITFSNGNVIEKPNAIDSLSLFVTQIGIERVASLGITAYRNYPLLSTSFISNKLQKKIGGRYYLFKNSSTTSKKFQIEQIIDGLQLDGIHIELVPKSQPI